MTVCGTAGKGTYSGLVDTGSDNTIFPMAVADRLGIATIVEEGPLAIVFGGHRVQLLIGSVTLELESGGEVIQWTTEVCYHDFANAEDETVILGHAGFLDYFTATFDGKQGTLTLVPNDDLPPAIQSKP